MTDGAGRYLHHLTQPVVQDRERDIFASKSDEEDNETKSQEKKPAEVVADLIVGWLREVGVDDSLELVAADSTNSNTGWKAGIIAWIEKKLGKKVTWLICALHTNELLLRHLMEALDGKTDSKTGFSGPLGKLLKQVPNMQRTQTFKKIEVGPDLIALPEDIVIDLSTDQELS